MDVLSATINIFLPPAIAIIGCYRRNIIDKTTPVILHYFTITMFLYLTLSIELWLIGFIFSQSWFIGGEKASIIATVQALCCPFVCEFIKKYIRVSVEIHEQK